MLIKKIARAALVTALILLVPLIAMQFTDEVIWTLSDFAFAGVLIFATGVLYELMARKTERAMHRAIIGAVLIVALVLVWIELAVGIF